MGMKSMAAMGKTAVKSGIAGKGVLFILVAMLAFTLYPTAALANSAEPPALTILVSSPPEDLELLLLLADGSTMEAIRLQKQQKAWEATYRIFYSEIPSGHAVSFEGATLIAQSTQKTFDIAFPESAFGYGNCVTLHVEQETIEIGYPLSRAVLLVSLRLVCTLLIEGALFYAFGYREKSSWIKFLIVNLITQGALNIAIYGIDANGYWILAFIFYEILIFITEMIALPLLLKEHKKGRAVGFAFLANAASVILGGILLANLPI